MEGHISASCCQALRTTDATAQRDYRHTTIQPRRSSFKLCLKTESFFCGREAFLFENGKSGSVGRRWTEKKKGDGLILLLYPRTTEPLNVAAGGNHSLVRKLCSVCIGTSSLPWETQAFTEKSIENSHLFQKWGYLEEKFLVLRSVFWRPSPLEYLTAAGWICIL